MFKCKMCGGTLKVEGNSRVATCEYCQTKQSVPKLESQVKADLYDRANHYWRGNEYDKAMAIFEQILAEDKEDAEAYWSLVLCRYGIEYVEDPKTKERIPTINRMQYTSIYADEDYKAALSYAEPEQAELFKKDAQIIDTIQKNILSLSSKEEPFDVFICYKESDEHGRRTEDSVLAMDLYNNLTRDGLKVFFARITLEDKLGTAYEPYIFAALNSAKVMVALGTKPEYFNAVWVKNEWSRYLALIKKGEDKVLIPAYKNMDPYTLPVEFSHLQAQDMAKIGFMQDLVHGIKKIVGVSPAQAAKADGNEKKILPLIKRAQLFLEDKDFASADEYAEKVLDIDPECAEAYVIKLLVSLKLCWEKDLLEAKVNLSKNQLFTKALRFASGELKQRLEGYQSANQAHFAKATKAPKSQKPEKQKSTQGGKKKGLIIGIIVAALCIAIVAVVLALTLGKNVDDNGDGEQEGYDYVVIFDPGEGAITSGESVYGFYAGERLGDRISSLPVPVREGYTFVRWVRESSGNQIPVSLGGTIVNSDLEIYAIWEREPSSDPEVGDVVCSDGTYNHRFNIGDYTAASCTSAGLTVQTCTECGFVKERTIAPTGHSLSGVFLFGGENGEFYKYKTCANCGLDVKGYYTNVTQQYVKEISILESVFGSSLVYNVINGIWEEGSNGVPVPSATGGTLTYEFELNANAFVDKIYLSGIGSGTWTLKACFNGGGEAVLGSGAFGGNVSSLVVNHGSNNAIAKLVLTVEGVTQAQTALWEIGLYKDEIDNEALIGITDGVHEHTYRYVTSKFPGELYGTQACTTCGEETAFTLENVTTTVMNGTPVITGTVYSPENISCLYNNNWTETTGTTFAGKNDAVSVEFTLNSAYLDYIAFKGHGNVGYIVKVLYTGASEYTTVGRGSFGDEMGIFKVQSNASIKKVLISHEEASQGTDFWQEVAFCRVQDGDTDETEKSEVFFDAGAGTVVEGNVQCFIETGSRLATGMLTLPVAEQYGYYFEAGIPKEQQRVLLTTQHRALQFLK